MTVKQEHGIVVVGAGHAGGRAVEAMRGAGYAGELTLVGKEPVRPYERPPLSKGMLLEAAPQPPFLRPESYYQDHDIDLRLNVSAAALDPDAHEIELSDGSRLGYSKLLLATGARPRQLAGLEGGGLPVFYLRDLDDALRLRAALVEGRRAVIVGGGVIGLELAAAARKRGCKVVVLEAAERVMSRVVSPLVATWIRSRHERFGVTILCDATIASVEPSGVRLADGQLLAADLLVVGVGITPNMELAERAGISTAEGIIVDATGRTDAPDIYAAGDVAIQFVPQFGRRVRLETWANAQNQAIAVGCQMCGGAAPAGEVPWYWTDQHDFHVQVAGNPLADVEVVRGDPAEDNFTLFHLRDGLVVGATAVNNKRDMAVARRLVQRMVRIDRAALADRAYDLRKALQ